MKKVDPEQKLYMQLTPEDERLLDEQARARMLSIIENPVSSELGVHIRKGLECHLVCIRAFIHCLRNRKTGNYKAKLKILQCCADISEINSDVLLTEQRVNKRINQLSSKIAENCARVCAKSPDQMLNQCAILCFDYARSCRLFW